MGINDVTTPGPFGVGGTVPEGGGGNATINIPRDFYNLRIVKYNKDLKLSTPMVEGINWQKATGGSGSTGTIDTLTGDVDFRAAGSNLGDDWYIFLSEEFETDFTTPQGGPLNSAALIDRIDRTEIKLQQLRDEYEKKALRLGDGDPLSFSNVMADPALRLDKVIGFNATTGDIALKTLDVSGSFNEVQADNGTESIALSTRWDRFFTPQDTGAVGNGSDSDTTAVQLALDTKGVIFFPPGQYVMRNCLMGTNTSIVGEGNGATVFVIDPAALLGDAILKNAIGGATNSSISGVTFQGNNLADAKGLSFTDSDRLTVESCRLVNFQGNAAEFFDCEDLNLLNLHTQTNDGDAVILVSAATMATGASKRVTIDNFTSLSDDAAAIVLRRVDVARVSGFRSLNSSNAGNTYLADIHIEDCTDVVVSDATSENSATQGFAVIFGSASDVKPTDIRFVDCKAIGADEHGFYVRSVERPEFYQCQARDNGVGASTGSGFFLATRDFGTAGTGGADGYLTDFELKDCLSRNNLEHGVHLRGPDRGRISECTLVDNSVGAGADYGIYSQRCLDGTEEAKFVTIKGNAIGNANGGGTQDQAIVLEEVSQDFVVVNNNLQGTTQTPPATLNSSTTNYARGNHGFSLAQTFTAINTNVIVPPKIADIVVITGTADIVSITGASSGREVILFFQSNAAGTGVLDSATLFIAGTFTYTAGSQLHLTSDGTNWYEVSRSLNA